MPEPDSRSLIEMTGGVRVVCPGNIGYMTSYVLAEQNDWFEDEIRFVRLIVDRKTRCVDVGANYGLYTLSIAKLCPEGRIWAFEPCAATAQCLAESVRVNGFTNVTLIQKAVSSQVGVATLLTHPNAEVNKLTASPDGAARSEQTALTTLDIEAADQGWSDIDFIKIDAEEHELQVLEGGRNFFASASPLVMLEVRAGNKVDLEPTRWLMALGYKPYRLVQGLGALVPQDIEQPLDGLQLNVFCCKRDRADELRGRGRLVFGPGTDDPARDLPNAWPEFFEAFPFGRAGLERWRRRADGRRGPGWLDYEEALNLYAKFRSSGPDLSVRYAALHACYDILAGMLRESGNPPRMLSYARVAADLGHRGEAAAVLKLFLEAAARQGGPLFVDEPFVPAGIEFETVEPGASLSDWMLASALEGYERYRHHSSYFAPGDTLVVARELRRLGFCSPEMERRAALATLRAGGAQ
jgi:FkbM family methyltransferase